jgi:hypothetical protein
MTPNRQAVRNRVGRLDAEKFADFVAAVWSARGWSVERDAGLLVARDGERQRRLAPVAVDRFGRPAPLSERWTDADVVVLAGDRAAVADDLDEFRTVLDVSELVDMFLYGIDSAVRERIAERYFGRSLAAIRPPAWRRFAGGVGRLVRGLRSVHVPREFVLVAIVIMAFAGGLIVLQDELTGTEIDGGPPANGVSTVTPIDPTTPTPDTPQSNPGVPLGATDVPGVRSDGTVDSDRLLEAHRRTLDGQSYSRTQSYQRPPPSDEPGRGLLRRETVERTPLRTLVEVRTTWTNGSQRGTMDLYSDGEHWYRAIYREGSFAYRNVSRQDSLVTVFPTGANTLERSLRTSENLSIEERRSTADGVRYRIVGIGAPTDSRFEDATNYSVTALVDRRGVVHELSANYTLPTDSREARASFYWTLDIDRDLVVGAPGWYRAEFANETSSDRRQS